MSWTGTVRCGHCYKSGHNIRGCDVLKAKAAADPNSYHADQWNQIQESKKRPKLCSYCKEPKHTRRTCVDLKENKETYIADGILWRKAFTKWISDKGIGPGTLVRTNTSYRMMDSDGGSTEVYTTDDSYERPVAFLISIRFPESHLVGNPRSGNWSRQSCDFSLTGQIMKKGIDKKYSLNTRLGIPRIPSLNPSKGFNHWGIQDHTEPRPISRWGDESLWDVISPSPKSFQPPENWVEDASIYDAEQFFRADMKKERDDFLSFDEDHRFVMQMYVDGDITVDQLKDPVVIDPNA